MSLNAMMRDASVKFEDVKFRDEIIILRDIAYHKNFVLFIRYVGSIFPVIICQIFAEIK